jgi:hypothetical protein
MESNDTNILTGLDIETISNLLGELGIETLALVVHGCSSDTDIMRLSSLSKSCLSVKIPLLHTLGLIEVDMSGYSATLKGVEAFREMRRW